MHSIRLPKQSTIGDVIDELKGKVLTNVNFCKEESASVVWDV